MARRQKRCFLRLVLIAIWAAWILDVGAGGHAWHPSTHGLRAPSCTAGWRATPNVCGSAVCAEGAFAAVHSTSQRAKKSLGQETIALFIDGDRYATGGQVYSIVEALMQQTTGRVVLKGWYGRSCHGWLDIAGVVRHEVGNTSQAADMALMSDVKACTHVASIAIAAFDRRLVHDVTQLARCRGQR
eukprot:6193385-Amphidinium_carterae.1